MMITVARTEPREPIVRASLNSDPREHLAAILMDFADQHVPVTRLNVMARALDVGLSEAVAVRIAGLLDEVQP